MLTVSKSFTAVGSGDKLLVRHGDSFTYAVSGTFAATAQLWRTRNGGLTSEYAGVSVTAAASGTIISETPDRLPAEYFFLCPAFTSGTMVTSIAEVSDVVTIAANKAGTPILTINKDGVSLLTRVGQKRIISKGAKVGTTAGFVVGAATNIGRMATCPASQTASTLVVPLDGLKVGDTITGFGVIGQIESAGGAVTLDANLRKLSTAAADLVDASVGSITQVSVVIDTAVGATNDKTGLTEVVGADETFYVLITATTAGSTDIDLQGISVIITEA